MKAFNWNDIRCTMKRTLAPPVPTAPEAFWNTFRLRAAMLPRRPVQAVAAPPRWFAVPGWALAVSCAVLFLAAAGVG